MAIPIDATVVWITPTKHVMTGTVVGVEDRDPHGRFYIVQVALNGGKVFVRTLLHSSRLEVIK